MPTKAFHLADILSVTTGYLVSPRHMDGIYEILNFLTQDELFTHVLAARAAGPWLLGKYPELRKPHEDLLAAAARPDWQNIFEAVVIDLAAKFCTGFRLAPYLDLEPMPAELWLRIDPAKELVSMVGEEKVIVVAPEAGA